VTLTGLPVVSVPQTTDPDGLPARLKIVGKPQGEEAVLELARQRQQRHPSAARRSLT
jgi:Asp-tRNA(Asn)/Glu-tRNA(Gln) amidotransferase A subunit family amidase